MKLGLFIVNNLEHSLYEIFKNLRLISPILLLSIQIF